MQGEEPGGRRAGRRVGRGGAGGEPRETEIGPLRAGGGRKKEGQELGRDLRGQGLRWVPGSKEASLGSPGLGLTTLPNYRFHGIFWSFYSPV